MAKRRREPKSDSAMPSPAGDNIVFVETSLDTHLAMLVSDSDTVLDFKRRLMQDHAQCFPKIGEIWFHSLKVKRKGNFYHLPDFLLVRSALHGVKGSWFLSADASGSLARCVNEKSNKCGTKDHSGVLSADANKTLALKMSMPDGVNEENIVSEMNVMRKVEKSSVRTSEFWRNGSLENSLGTRSPVKKKRKMKDPEHVLSSPTLDDPCTLFHASGEGNLQPVLAGCKIDACEETPITAGCGEETAEDAGRKLVVLETLMFGKPQNELGQNAPTAHLKGDTDINAFGKKKIKRRKGKQSCHDQVARSNISSADFCNEDISANWQSEPPSMGVNNPEVSRPLKEINVKRKASSSTIGLPVIDGKDNETDQPDISERQMEESQNHDQVPLQSEKSETLDQDEARGNTRGSIPRDDFLGANEEMECGSRSIAKVKMSGGKICYAAGGELSELPNLELISLKHYETAKTDKSLPTERTSSILPAADGDLNLGGKEDRNSLVNIETGKNQPEAGVAIIEPKLPSIVVHASCAFEDTFHSNDKRKKKKTKKSAGKIQDTSDREKETQKAEGEKLHHDFEVLLPSPSKTSGCTDPEIKFNGEGYATKLLDGTIAEKLETSRGHGRNKSVKKSADIAMDSLGVEPANYGTSCSVLLCPPADHLPEERDKRENILFRKVNVVHAKMLDVSAADSIEEVHGVAGKDSDFMKLTQTVEDVDFCEQRMEKRNHSSTGDCLTAVPALEKDNQVNGLKLSHAQNCSENVRVKDKKSKKKTKKEHVALDILENIPVKDQEVGGELHSTAEKGNNFLNSEQERGLVDSSHVLSQRSKEKLEEIDHTAANTDNVARHVEVDEEGIDFKHYFSPGQERDKIDSVDKVQEATKSSEEMKTTKKVKKRSSSTVSTSTESRYALKSSENKDCKDESLLRFPTGRKDRDSLESLKVSENGAINSGPIRAHGMTTHKKHNENTVVSSFPKDKSTPLDKSGSEMSGTFSGDRGKKTQQSGISSSDKIVMKTPEKKNLFAKVGSFFEDCSGESSGDENRTRISDASTCSSSDNSSRSGSLANESDMMQASTRNESIDARGRITSRKNNAKLDLSVSNEITMHMILRSSKRFKEAKLMASQNETEQIDSQPEFVPESQLNE